MARQNLVDIKSIYAVLTDMIHKNIEKVRFPRFFLFHFPINPLSSYGLLKGIIELEYISRFPRMSVIWTPLLLGFYLSDIIVYYYI